MEAEVEKFLSNDEAIPLEYLLNAEFVKALANSARELENRKKLIDGKKFALSKWPNNLSVDLMIELCRLFGNLCFNSSEGRILVENLDLLSTLGSALQQTSGSDIINTKLILVLPAFLQNFCIDNMESSELISPVLSKMSLVLSSTNELSDTGPLEDLLMVLADDTGLGIHLFDTPLIRTASNIITSAGPDVNPDLITALINFPEHEEKDRLFLEGINYSALQTNLDIGMYSEEKDQDSGKSTKELICELFVMSTSTAQIQDIDLPSLISWLNRDNNLRSTALLILGNLCTSDESTEAIATPEFIDSAIRNLAVRDKSVEHALLGCLRNCAVNPKSRELLVSKDVGDHLVKTSEVLDDPALMQKLVAILRLLALCSEAVASRVGQDADFICKLVQMGRIENQFSAALGLLNVETGRLFSTVIVKTQNRGIMHTIVDKSGLPYLLSLLSSPHLVMLNQAVLPLCLLYTLDPLPDNLIQEVNTDVINKIVCILDIKQPLEGYKMVHENVLKLFTVMIGCKHQQTLTLLRESNLESRIKSYQSSLNQDENQTEYQLTQQIIDKLSS